MAIENVIPTRMELMRIKARIGLATKGHSLLKRKRDALILELFQVLKKAKDIRKELNKALREAYLALYNTTVNHSEAEIEAFASSTAMTYDLDINPKNVMGVKVPRIDFNVKDLKKPVHLSPLADYVADIYMKILPLIIQTAEIETTVKRLLHEIEKTKRRVNALEYNLIPGLNDQKKNIIQKLEELERDSFVSLKSIKAKLEKEAESNAV
jgi:V/A-type H+-transporting ATPase subunit D